MSIEEKINQIKAGSKIEFTIYGNIDQRAAFSGTYAGVFYGPYVPASANHFVNHSNIYPKLPEFVREVISDDFTSYNYLVLVGDDGITRYIGLPWIISTSLKTVLNRTLEITLPNFDKDPLQFRKELEGLGVKIGRFAMVEN